GPVSAETPAKDEVRPEAGFYTLSLKDAQKKARADSKIVMVQFYGENCPFCKKLDTQTMAEKEVQSWLVDNTGAIRLNGQKENELRDEHKIAKYPTILFLKPNGTVYGRIDGFVDKATFLRKTAALFADRPSK